MRKGMQTCPECGHRFKGFGWDGIDSHWKSKHDHKLPYAEAWPLIRSGNYRKTLGSFDEIVKELKGD